MGRSRARGRGSGGGLHIWLACLIGLLSGGIVALGMLVPSSDGWFEGRGRIVAVGEVATVRSEDPALLSQLLVADGTRVRAGDVLFRLRVTDALARTAELIVERDTLKARILRLRAEREGAEKPDFRPLLARGSDGAEAAVATQMEVFWDHRAARETALRGLSGAAERAAAEERRIARVTDELEVAEAELSAIRREIGRETERAARGEVVAPISGLVFNVNRIPEGGEVGPETPVLSILAETAALRVKTSLPARDRSGLRSGMEAQIRYVAPGSQAETTVPARLAWISADPVPSEGNAREARFAATLTLDQEAEGLLLAPDTPVMITLPPQGRTMVEYLFSPLRDALIRSIREA